MGSVPEYYGYTDRAPTAWHLAVDNKRRRTRFYIDYTIVKLHFLCSNRYKVGIEEAEIDGKPVKRYNRERTICDLRSRRNKVDGEVFDVAIQRYVQDPKKVETRLMKYAKLLRVEKGRRDAWSLTIKNMAASLLMKLKNQSKEEGIFSQMILQLFAQEEYLRKLTFSRYADNLILKGGMDIYTTG